MRNTIVAIAVYILYATVVSPAYACNRTKQVIVEGEGKTSVEAMYSAVILAVSQVRGVKIAASDKVESITTFNNNDANQYSSTTRHIITSTSGIVSALSVINDTVVDDVHYIKLKASLCLDPVVYIKCDCKTIRYIIQTVLQDNFIFTSNCMYGCDYKINYSNMHYTISNGNNFTLYNTTAVIDVINYITKGRYAPISHYSLVFSGVHRHASRYKLERIIKTYLPAKINKEAIIYDSTIKYMLIVPGNLDICSYIHEILNNKVVIGTIHKCDKLAAVIKLQFE